MSQKAKENGAHGEAMVMMVIRVPRKLKARYKRIASARTTPHQKVASADVAREALIKFNPEEQAA